MITILGAGGAIGNELLPLLAARGGRVRLVGRNPKPAAGAETVKADLALREDALRAVAGSDVVFLLAGLKYEVKLWRELWPSIMRNTIDACKQARARLIFFDNVYMYGKVEGAMTEETPFHPCSEKGEIRASIATMLLDEIRAGNITAQIARSADFYGPSAKTGVANILVFDKLAAGAKPVWLANAGVPHSFTWTPDAARGLVCLMDSDAAWNQTWHLPTAPDPPTGRQFIAMAAKEFGKSPDYRMLPKVMIKVVGWFDPTVRELYEMLYQNQFPYLFDYSKFAKAFGLRATTYPEGIRQAACHK